LLRSAELPILAELMDFLLHDLGVAVLAATALGLLAHFLRQPVILGYLVAGALVGPAVGFGWVHELSSIDTISEIGLILLLFIIGLEMDLGRLKASGKPLLIAGLGQFPLCVAVGMVVFPSLGYALSGDDRQGLYLALIAGLSSTAIVVKLLYDRFELDTEAGRITVGVLVVQDLYAILVLACQPNFTDPSPWPLLRALGASAVLLICGFVFSRVVLSRLFTAIARSPELVVATSLGWCVAVAGAAGAMGLSKEMGALVAGLAISAFPYSLHVTAKTLPLRDFFLTLFFVALGMQISPPSWALVWPVLWVTVVVIGSRFATLYPLLALGGAGRRTAFLVSLNLAQISEFGLVIATLGVAYGHLHKESINVVLYSLAVTAVLSSYGIRFSQPLFRIYDRWLSRIGLSTTRIEQLNDSTCDRHPVALLGVHRAAQALIDSLPAAGRARLLAVDFHPETLKRLKALGIAGRFGDLASLDTLHHAHLAHAEIIISSIPDMLLKGITNRALVQAARTLAPQATIIATADRPEQHAELLAAGANIVVNPYELLGDRLADLISQHAS
jgi:Kef-type K+ transport system membrane component KefB